MCLVGFASLQSPWAHTLRRPCLACPSRCTKPFHSHNHFKRTSIPRSTPHSPKKTQKIRHLSKQRILYIQFSAFVKMVSGSKAMMLQQRPHHPAVTATYQIITLYNPAVPPSSANCHHFQRRNLKRHIAAPPVT